MKKYANYYNKIRQYYWRYWRIVVYWYVKLRKQKKISKPEEIIKAKLQKWNYLAVQHIRKIIFIAMAIGSEIIITAILSLADMIATLLS